jgi:hypothetical protein
MDMSILAFRRMICAGVYHRREQIQMRMNGAPMSLLPREVHPGRDCGTPLITSGL